MNEYVTDTACMDLSELQAMIKDGVEDAVPGYFWVRAELASLSVKGAGHCYMELCQSEKGKVVAQIRAIAWASVYRQLSAYFTSVTGVALQQGQNVMLHACVQYSSLYGLSLIVDDVNPEFTLGDAEARRAQTLERLEKEGLTNVQKGLQMPFLPYSLAVISSSEAAGYRDFARQLHENPAGYGFSTELFEAAMQGTQCASSIAEALKKLAESPSHFDAVLILRGGGGKLDLGCFDEYELCRAIALCPVPVLTAIGHDQDVHNCDLVAYEALKTPTALADWFLDRYSEADAALDRLTLRLDNAATTRVRLLETRLDLLEARLDAADPARLLARGFIMVLDASGHPVNSASRCRQGDALTLMLRDGKLRVKVNSVEIKN